MPTLKEKVDAANKAKYQAKEETVYANCYNLMVKTIEDSWIGKKLKVQLKHSGSLEVYSNTAEYISIVDRVCDMLNEADHLAGFKFQREGSGHDADGCGGEPVYISITDADSGTKE